MEPQNWALVQQDFDFFSIAMGSDYSFYVKSIATYAPTFLGYNNSVLAIVMTQIRLNHLMICAIYHDYLGTLDIEELANVFVLRKS